MLGRTAPRYDVIGHISIVGTFTIITNRQPGAARGTVAAPPIPPAVPLRRLQPEDCRTAGVGCGCHQPLDWRPRPANAAGGAGDADAIGAGATQPAVSRVRRDAGAAPGFRGMVRAALRRGAGPGARGAAPHRLEGGIGAPADGRDESR